MEGETNENIAVTEAGEFFAEPGSKVNKKFKFFNDKVEPLQLTVVSNFPLNAKVKTQNLEIPVGGFEYIKFTIDMPLTPCTLDVCILLLSKAESKFKPEELFKITLKNTKIAN